MPYLALNPNGVVPTLVHDGEPIIQSPRSSTSSSTTPSRAHRCAPADPVQRRAYALLDQAAGRHDPCGDVSGDA